MTRARLLTAAPAIVMLAAMVYRAAWHSARRRARGRVQAEAALDRVRQLATAWHGRGPALGTSINRWWDTRLIELNTAINEPKEG